MPFWCWSDEFVYQQCCDKAYGNHGLELCFSEAISFELCCPKPNFDDLLNFDLHRELADSPWQTASQVHAVKNGCDAEIYWLPNTLSNILLSRSNYHPKTGEVTPLSSNSTDMNNVKESLERHLAATKDFSLRTFVRGAVQYYLTASLDIETDLMKNSILASNMFGYVFQECPQAAFLAGFLKFEEIYHRDRIVAVELKGWLTTLLKRAYYFNRVAAMETWGGDHALNRIETLMQAETSDTRTTVDLVVPLCSTSDIASLASSLKATLNEIPDLGYLSPQNIKVELRLNLYDICGLMAGDVSEDILSRHASEKVFGELSENALACFRVDTFGRGAFQFPHIHVTELTEEVPTGDAAAYLHHLAKAASRHDLADLSIFLHPDFAEHIRVKFLQHIFGSLVSGAWPLEKVDFLYLGWRHDGVAQDGRVGSTLRPRCSFDNGQIKQCWGSPPNPLAATVVTSDFVGFNPVLLSNLWYLAFGWSLNATFDDFGGYDFSQLLVSRRAVLSRPASYWQYLAHAISAKSSFQLLPGTTFVSNRVDLTPSHGFNKGVCIWFEHMWHLLLDHRFHPERRYLQDAGEEGSDFRAFTRLADKALPLFLRTGKAGPDNMMLRHYILTPDEQCKFFWDHSICRLAAWQARNPMV